MVCSLQDVGFVKEVKAKGGVADATPKRGKKDLVTNACTNITRLIN